jgi:tetratricopeptide (TPR) repeat protein
VGGEYRLADRSNSESATMNRSVLICLSLVALTVGVYWQVHSFDFVAYDDEVYVVNNPNVNTGLTFKNIKWAFTTEHASNWDPVTWMSHMLDCQLFGIGRPPRGHHLVSLFIHVVNTLLMFALFRRMTGAIWKPAIVAALFAIHPLHVESVAWIAERKDVLSTFFWLLCMLFYVAYAQSNKKRWYGFSILALALGLMSKPMLVTAPFLLLLLDYWPLERLFRGEDRTMRNAFRLVLEKMPMFVLIAGMSAVTFVVQSAGGAVNDSLPLVHRVTNALVAYVRYIGKTFYPINLAVLYPNFEGMWGIGHVIGAIAFLAIVTAVVLMLRERRYLTVGWFWYLGTLVPVVGLVSIGSFSMADRFMYVPMTGLLIMLAWGGEAVCRGRRAGQKLCAAIAIIGLIACLWLTPQQVAVWRDSITLFQHTVDSTRNNAMMHFNLGKQLEDAGQDGEAESQYRLATEIVPPYRKAYNNLGNLLFRRKEYEGALGSYSRAASAYPEDSLIHYNIGTTYSLTGRHEEAKASFQRALQLNQVHEGAHHNLASLYLNQGALEDAIHHFREVLRINPESLPSLTMLAVALEKKGNTNDLIPVYEQLLRLKPEDTSVREKLERAKATVGGK